MDDERGPMGGGSPSVALYNLLAKQYDSLFDAPGHRNVYDRLAWEHVSRYVPARDATIIDVGCGTGRWAAKWIAAGHRVIGIEESPGMIAELSRKKLGANFELIQTGMETVTVKPTCADLVVAMGSLQYAHQPCMMIEKFVQWVRPGGAVCVVVDSLVALLLELLRLGSVPQALENLKSRRGAWVQGGLRAPVHLLDRRALETYFESAGLCEISSHGLLVTASAWGRERLVQSIADDHEAVLGLERQLSQFPVLADVGKHLLVTGRRPVINALSAGSTELMNTDSAGT